MDGSSLSTAIFSFIHCYKPFWESEDISSIIVALGEFSLVRNPSLTLQGTEVGGYVLITVSVAGDQIGLSVGGCSAKYAVEERGAQTDGIV